MKVLLTGGAGYIGSHVCNFLIDNGHEITTIDDLSTGNKKLIPQQAIHLNCDISNVEVISNHLKKNKVVNSIIYLVKRKLFFNKKFLVCIIDSYFGSRKISFN